MLFGLLQINPRVGRYEALKGSGRLDIIENKDLLLNITDLYQKNFPSIIRRNEYFNSLRSNNLFPFISDHLQLDAGGKGTNWQELFRSSKMRLMLSMQELSENCIVSYSEGIDQCNRVIHQIDAE